LEKISPLGKGGQEKGGAKPEKGGKDPLLYRGRKVGEIPRPGGA